MTRHWHIRVPTLALVAAFLATPVRAEAPTEAAALLDAAGELPHAEPPAPPPAPALPAPELVAPVVVEAQKVAEPKREELVPPAPAAPKPDEEDEDDKTPPVLNGFDLALELWESSGIVTDDEAYENQLTVYFEPKYAVGKQHF